MQPFSIFDVLLCKRGQNVQKLNNLKGVYVTYFNKQMKKSLFQILDNEDSYLDVESISSKLKDCIIKSN